MTDGKRRQRRKAERPQEIVSAAVELFAERGFAATQMQDVANRAGVAKGTIYLYFQTKQELFEEVVRSKTKPVVQQVDDLLKRHDASAVELLRRVLTLLYDELVESPTRRAVIRVLIAEGTQFPELVQFYHREVLQFAQRLMAAVMELGRSTGEFRDCPAIAEPRVVIGAAMMASIWRMTFEPFQPLDAKAFLEAHFDVVVNGLLKR